MQRWTSLVAVLADHLESRSGLLVKFKGYHEQHLQVDRGVEELLGDIQQIEGDDNIPLRDRIIQLEVCDLFFVLRSCYTAGFALCHPIAFRCFQSWMSPVSTFSRHGGSCTPTIILVKGLTMFSSQP